MKWFYTFLAVIGMAALSAGSAFAIDDIDCNGNGSCTHANFGTTNQGGAGGAGGQGGAGGVGIGGGAHVFAPSYQSQGQGQHQGQGQGQHQGQFTNQANKQSIVIEAPVIPTKTEQKNAPDVGLGGLYPSANCHGTSNVGFSIMGGGGGVGTSWQDDDCGYRETARIFGPTTPDGLAVLCSSKYAKEAPSCKKLAAVKKAEETGTVKLVQEDQRSRPISPPAKSETTRSGVSRAWYEANPDLIAK